MSAELIDLLNDSAATEEATATLPSRWLEEHAPQLVEPLQRQGFLLRDASPEYVEYNGDTHRIHFMERLATARNLRKRIAYRLQELLYGGLSDEDAAKLDALADEDPLANLEKVPTKRLTRTRGTRFVRVWKGVSHEVIANGDGTFEYDGRVWKSLSAIARAITGTRWNGKLFFGVR